MIKVYGLKSTLEGKTDEFSKVINSCLVETLKFPENKKSQRFITLDKNEFYYPEGRSDNYILLEISMMQGRSKEAKKALIKLLFKRFKEFLYIDPIDLEIIITEQPPENWGFRGMCGDEAKLNYKVNV